MVESAYVVLMREVCFSLALEALAFDHSQLQQPAKMTSVTSPYVMLPI